jgi:predicted permease
LFGLRRHESDLSDELNFHMEMQIRKNIAAGASPEEAQRRARIVFGEMEQAKEACRDSRGLNKVLTILQDSKYAVRTFLRAPAFSVTVVVTIGLALGLNTALFTLFDAYMLRPLAIRDPHSFYRFTWINRQGNQHTFARPELEEFIKTNPTFSDVIASETFYARLEGHPAFGQAVTGNFFSVLGVTAQKGRALIPDDARTAMAIPLMVLSDSAWRRKFGGDPSIIGKTLNVRGQPLEVVGIATSQFTGIDEQPIDFWVPISLAERLSPEPDHFEILGHLAPDLTLGQTHAKLQSWVARTTADGTASDRGARVKLELRATVLSLSHETIAAILPIAIAFALVLLIACANTANMMLARGIARQREIGIRLSIGAARSRLIRQLLTESALLSLPAAAAGFLLSRLAITLGVRALFATLPQEFAEFVTIVPLEPDARVFGFILAAAVCATLLFGLAPALQCTRGDVIHAARGDFGNEYRPMRFRNALVLVQITMSVLLLISAGVLLRGAGRLGRIDRGLNLNGVIALFPEQKYREAVVDQLAGFPFVREVAGVDAGALDGALPNVTVIPEHTSKPTSAWYRLASREYFTLLNVPILRGRNFTRAEMDGGEPVAIVSKSTAELLWAGRNAIGQSFSIVHDSHGGVPPGPLRYDSAIVIGVAKDVISGWVGNGLDKTCIYFPTSIRSSAGALLTRVDGNADAAMRKLDTSLSAAHPGAISQIHNMRQADAMQIYPFRVGYCIAMAIGAVGFLLTLSGIYGLLSYVVTQRTKEIGIRVALGATPSSAARLILSQAISRATVGIALGALLALIVSTLIAAAVPMINVFDTVAYLSVVGLVFVSCAAAAWVPALRAASVDPLDTLRYE